MLLHDAQYTAAELPARAEFGHSAVELRGRPRRARRVRRLLLFHHDPPRTDDAIDEHRARPAAARTSRSQPQPRAW